MDEQGRGFDVRSSASGRPGTRRESTSTLGTAFPRLDQEQIARLAQIGDEIPVHVGAALIRAGEPATALYVMLTASADLLQESTPLRPATVVRSFGPGEFIGEMNLLVGRRAYLSIVVTHAGAVLRLDRDAIAEVMSAGGRLARLLLTAFQARRSVLMEAAATALEVTGRAGTSDGLALRNFLTRMSVPHTWHEPDTEEGRACMAAVQADADSLPVAVRTSEVAFRADARLVASWLGLRDVGGDGAPRPDVVIVGAGPAGLACAIGCASEGLDVVVLDRAGPGGQAGASSRIENYMGFPAGLSGGDLATRAAVQALKFGARLVAPVEVTGLRAVAPGEVLVGLDTGEALRARAVVLATGVDYRTLGLPTEHELLGEGLYSAATQVEADLCRGRPCLVLGGANSAGQAALFLADQGCQVTMVIRSEGIRSSMSSYLARRIEATNAVKILPRCRIRSLERVDSDLRATLESQDLGLHSVHVAAVFRLIGGSPRTDGFDGRLDEHGFVATTLPRVDDGPPSAALTFETSVPSVFAVGDVRAGSLKRVAAAAGEGASVVASIHQSLARDAERDERAH